jgi:hypothetical protein
MDFRDMNAESAAEAVNASQRGTFRHFQIGGARIQSISRDVISVCFSARSARTLAHADAILVRFLARTPFSRSTHYAIATLANENNRASSQ